jgi:hypothetical protein
MAQRSPFEVLGLTPDAEPVAIEAVYRALARKYHPDANPGVPQQDLLSRMAELNWAHDELAQDLDGWRGRARAGSRRSGGLNWGSPEPPRQQPAPPPQPRPAPAAPRKPKSGLNWGNFKPPPAPEPDFIELEWHRRRKQQQQQPSGQPDQRAAAPERRWTPQFSRSIVTDPRVVNLSGHQGSSAGFIARVEGGGGAAHIQCRFREGPFEIVRRGGQGVATAFEIVLTEDVFRPTADPVLYTIDVVAREVEGSRLVLAIQPLAMPGGAPRPPRRRNFDEYEADFDLIRWV